MTAVCELCIWEACHSNVSLQRMVCGSMCIGIYNSENMGRFALDGPQLQAPVSSRQNLNA